ncbi:MAG: hypothetical protein ABEI57_04385 [Halapricum sp.]
MSASAIDLGELLTDTRTNALLGWVLVGFVVVTAATNLLLGATLWAVFAFALAVLLVIPPIALARPRAMIPWEVTLLATIPVIAHSLTIHPLYGQVTTNLSIAAIALIVAVELHVFTPVRMNVTFAVLFVVITTLAMAGLWAILRWTSDVTLGTTFILDPALTEPQREHQLMIEFVASTVAGIFAGIVFEYYVRRKARTGERLPSEVQG